ncbi:MAG: hypothetical protein ACI9H6_000376 [Patiriisocius sp.]|jgi:hypothetical protein
MQSKKATKKPLHTGEVSCLQNNGILILYPHRHGLVCGGAIICSFTLTSSKSVARCSRGTTFLFERSFLFYIKMESSRVR